MQLLQIATWLIKHDNAWPLSNSSHRLTSMKWTKHDNSSSICSGFQLPLMARTSTPGAIWLECVAFHWATKPPSSTWLVGDMKSTDRDTTWLFCLTSLRFPSHTAFMSRIIAYYSYMIRRFDQSKKIKSKKTCFGFLPLRAELKRLSHHPAPQTVQPFSKLEKHRLFWGAWTNLKVKPTMTCNKTKHQNTLRQSKDLNKMFHREIWHGKFPSRTGDSNLKVGKSGSPRQASDLGFLSKPQNSGLSIIVLIYRCNTHNVHCMLYIFCTCMLH